MKGTRLEVSLSVSSTTWFALDEEFCDFIKDKDLKYMAHLSELTEVSLPCSMYITDITPLGKLKKLRKLNLKGARNITSSDIAKLQAQLPNCEIIF